MTTRAAKKLICSQRGVKIGYPEGKFCWNNEKRFGGLQYCREHQAAFYWWLRFHVTGIFGHGERIAAHKDDSEKNPHPAILCPPTLKSFRISGRKARPWPGRSGGDIVPVFEGRIGSIQRSSFQSMYSR